METLSVYFERRYFGVTRKEFLLDQRLDIVHLEGFKLDSYVKKDEKSIGLYWGGKCEYCEHDHIYISKGAAWNHMMKHHKQWQKDAITEH